MMLARLQKGLAFDSTVYQYFDSGGLVSVLHRCGDPRIAR